MLKNSPIKNKTDTMGFLLTMTNIPQRMDANETKLNKPWLEPFVNVSFKRYRFDIKSIYIFFISIIKFTR